MGRLAFALLSNSWDPGVCVLTAIILHLLGATENSASAIRAVPSLPSGLWGYKGRGQPLFSTVNLPRGPLSCKAASVSPYCHLPSAASPSLSSLLFSLVSLRLPLGSHSHQAETSKSIPISPGQVRPLAELPSTESCLCAPRPCRGRAFWKSEHAPQRLPCCRHPSEGW